MKSCLILVLVLLSVGVFAADGSSGCGPGWYVAKKNTLLSSSLRFTTNVILAPTVTLGMTFGTSNCTKHSVVKSNMEDLKFATENYFEVAVDTSKGNGEFLTAYSELLGCSSQNKIFKKEMQKNFSKIFPTNNINPKKLVEETYNVILSNKLLRLNCAS